MSASAAHLLQETHRLGFILSVNGDKLHVEPVPPAELAATLKANKPEIMARLKLEGLAVEACAGLTGYITPDQLLSKLAPEDLVDIEAMAGPLPFLRAFACACAWTDMRRQGIAPPGWTHAAHCDRCGPVLLWATVEVAGCPWCWNRLHGVKIPRPPA